MKRVNSDSIKKRFNETVAQFNAIVHEQQDVLKSLKLEVASEQKTAVSLLERSKKLNQSLDDQEPKITSLHERITEFHQLLPQLMSMTEVAQKNITNIQGESEYIDGIGKRIKTTQELLQQVEAGLAQVHTDFEQQNQKLLQDVEARVLASSQTRGNQLIESMNAIVDRSNTVLEDLTEAIQSVEEKEAGLQVIAENSVVETERTVKDLVEQQVADYGKKIEQKTEQVIVHHETSVTNAEQRISDKIAEFNDLTSTYAAKFDENKNVFDELESSIQKQTVVVTDSLSNFEERISRLTTEKEKAFVQSVQNLQLGYGKLVSDTRKELQNSEKEVTEHIRSVSAEAEQVVTAAYQSVNEGTADIEDRCVKILDTAHKKLETLHTEVAAIQNTALITIQEHFDSQVRKTQDENETAIQELRTIVTGIRSEKDVIQTAIDEKLEALHALVDTKQKSSQTELLHKIEKAFAVTTQEIERTSSAMSQRLLQNIATQKGELKKDNAKLWNDLSAIQERVNVWKKDIHKTLAETTTQVEDTKDELHAAHEGIHKEFASLNERSEHLKKDVEGIESILSEKQAALVAQSKKEIETQFLSVRDLMGEKIRLSEEGLVEQVRQDIQTLEEQLQFRVKRLESVPEHIDTFENQLRESVRETHDTLVGELQEQRSRFEDKQAELFALVNELKHNLEDSMVKHTDSLQRQNQNAEEQVKQIQNSFETKLTELRAHLGSQLGSSEKELLQLVEEKAKKLDGIVQTTLGSIETELTKETRSEHQKARFQVFQTIEELTREIEDLRTRGEASLSESREQMSGQKQQFQKLTEQLGTEFHAMLNQEFSTKHAEWKKQYQGQFQEVTNELIGQEKTFLEQFTRLQNDLLQIEQRIENQSLQVTRTQTEIFDTLDEKKASYSEEFIAIMQGTRDQFVDIRTRLLEQFTLESTALEKQLEKLEKKHTNFVGQTRIFDRIEQNTNELKKISVDVQNDIENLRQERKWLHELEVHIQKTKKNAREAEQQLAKFLGEKRRIDQLEKEFSSLMQQSHAIEVKMQDVVAQGNDVEKVQLMLRHLKDIESEVEERNTRLLEKKDVIDTTIDGVQKGFSQLQSLEEQLSQYNEKLIGVPIQINDVHRALEQIETRQDELKTLSDRADTVDTLLNDSEQRIEKLETAREWLAREETRYSEIKRQIQDQLQSLNQLVQTDLTEMHKEAGAPSKNSRKTVIQLSKQGWNADEISRVTKLSKGEVELILEMATESIT